MRQKISIVAPFYNEAGGIDQFYHAMCELASKMPDCDLEIVCVDDGSTDDTLDRLVLVAAGDPRFLIIELSTNFGKELAMTAGIDAATGDAVVPIDADLQDPPELVVDMVKRWRDGADVVLARRVDRSNDSAMKRLTAQWFYAAHNKLSRTKIPQNVGDFRLMDRRVVDAVKMLNERQRFMKGIFAWVGFRTETIDYIRNSRMTGISKFSGWKLWNFALEGFTSFSTAPLRIWTYVGMIGAAASIMFAAYIVIRVLFFGVDTPGYASILVAVVMFGSLQLLSIGIIGEYIGRIYIESKQRPKYLIRRIHGGS